MNAISEGGISRRQFVSTMGAASLLISGGSLLAASSPVRFPIDPEKVGIDQKKLEELSSFLLQEIDKKTVPGAALIASRRGTAFMDGVWGTYCHSSEKTEPMRRDLIHTFFSYSKLVAATVLATLIQEGLLELDVPIRTYIPEYQGGNKEKTTLRHLLTHSAGIPNVPIGTVETEEKWKKAVETICNAKADWEPGSRSLYHGLTGQLVGAEAARRVLKGASWEAICRERLFDPLSAESLTYDPPKPTEKFALIPIPEKLPSAQGKLGNVLLGHPAGGCFGTASDALKVLHLHLQKGKWNGKTLLHPSIYREMHTVQYAEQLAASARDGKPSLYQSWGLGPLLRGEGPADGGHAWFGFRDQKNPALFGHAGISTVIGVADPASQIAFFFATTDAPQPEQRAVELRNQVTNRLLGAVKS